MNDNPKTPPAGASTVAPATTEHSKRASPYSAPTSAAPGTSGKLIAIPSLVTKSPTTITSKEAMATPGFLPSAHAFANGLATAPHPSSTQSPASERNSTRGVANPFVNPPSTVVTVLIRRLPPHLTEEALRYLVVWADDLVDVEILPVEMSEDNGFQTGLAHFHSRADALEAKRLLDGRCISKDSPAEIIVEIIGESPAAKLQAPVEAPSAGPSSAASSTASSGAPPRHAARFNGAYPPGNEFPNPDFSAQSAHYQALFSPQSPIGNHITEINRVSGKTLIASDSPDDDETNNLLMDPLAYAENGSTAQRRATAPQIPIGRMAGLSLNTNNPNAPGPSPLPQYAGSVSAHPGPMSPLSSAGTGIPYPLGMQPFPRHNFPPVNPADQNPPCNTLYVGNLPIDTSEEELKAMFSKQRGYKRLCFRTKQNGPMCFVEFEDISFATKALHELYGQPLHNSVKGGIRLSFSKNPLGVRSGQAPGQGSSGLGGMNGMMTGSANGFSTANGPPPGLAAPPGLVPSRAGFHGQGTPNGHTYQAAGFASPSSSPWSGPAFNMNTPSGSHPGNNLQQPIGVPPNGMSPNGAVKSSSGFPAHMMGR